MALDHVEGEHAERGEAAQGGGGETGVQPEGVRQRPVGRRAGPRVSGLRRVSGLGRVGGLVPGRVRDAKAQPDQQGQGDHAGRGQHSEGRGVVAAGGRQDGGDGERADQRADLVHRLVHGEAAAAPGGGGRVGEQGVLGRRAHRLADAFGDDQRARHPQGAGQAEERDGGHGQGVAGDRPGPEPAGAVGQRPGDQPQDERGRLADTGDDAHRQGGGAQRGQQRPGDRAGALVDEVHQQADRAERHHEAPRPHPRGTGPTGRRTAGGGAHAAPSPANGSPLPTTSLLDTRMIHQLLTGARRSRCSRCSPAEQADRAVRRRTYWVRRRTPARVPLFARPLFSSIALPGSRVG